MHVVTKILIVFGALLSILLSGLAIAYSFNADAIRKQVDSERSEKAAVQADLAAERTKTADQVAALTAAKESSENDRARLFSEKQGLQTENAQLRASVQEAKLEADRVKNQTIQQDVTVSLQASLIKTLSDEVTKLRSDMLASSRRETQLVDRLNDLESQRQVLEQSTRALQEQLQEAKMTIEGSRSAGGAGGPAMGVVTGSGRTTPVEGSGPVVRGRVVQVVKSAGGEELAEIDVGSAQGLRVNQQLTIVRDGFLANLVLTRVELNSSVGRVDKLGRTVDVRGGDVVLSRVN